MPQPHCNQRVASNYDAVVELKGGHPQRVLKLHPSYMLLQFPLLFLYGSLDFIQNANENNSSYAMDRRLTMNMFYTYQLHPHTCTTDLLFRSGLLFQQYVGIKFTCEGRITDIDKTRTCYYTSCHSCQKKVQKNDDVYIWTGHEPQLTIIYRYNFKARVKDETRSALFTVFSPGADKLTGMDCEELLHKQNSIDTAEVPSELSNIEGRTYVLQFHFNTTSPTGATQFIIDDVFQTLGR